MTVVGNLDLVSKPYMNATHWHIKSSFQLTKQKLNQISYPYKLFFCNEIQLIGILHRAPPKYVTKLRDPDGVRECCRSVRSTCSQSLNAGSPLWRSLISFEFNDYSTILYVKTRKFNWFIYQGYTTFWYIILVHKLVIHFFNNLRVNATELGTRQQQRVNVWRLLWLAKKNGNN